MNLHQQSIDETDVYLDINTKSKINRKDIIDTNKLNLLFDDSKRKRLNKMLPQEIKTIINYLKYTSPLFRNLQSWLTQRTASPRSSSGWSWLLS